MQKEPLKRGRGRPPKDPALVLRDQYWGLTLQSELPEGDSLASLERKLYPNLTVRKREHGEGNAQPFALTKVAQGMRGICADHSVPEVVIKAASYCPGSLAAYRSVLWTALCEPIVDHDRLIADDQIAPEVRSRFGPKHFQCGGMSKGRLSVGGVQRASRLAHRDALGLLLLNCPSRIAIRRTSLYAAKHVEGAFLRACQADPVLRTIKAPLADLIAKRIEHDIDLNNMTRARLFSVKRVSLFSASLELLLR